MCVLGSYCVFGVYPIASPTMKGKGQLLELLLQGLLGESHILPIQPRIIDVKSTLISYCYYGLKLFQVIYLAIMCTSTGTLLCQLGVSQALLITSGLRETIDTFFNLPAVPCMEGLTLHTLAILLPKSYSLRSPI